MAALSAGHPAERDLHRLALAARGRQDRAPAAGLRQALADGAGQDPQAGQVRHLLLPGDGLFLDIHTPKYKDKREVIWDMAVAMNKELLALRDAGCRCIQIEEPSLPLHGQHLRQGPRRSEVHDRRLQPRGGGPRRRGTLDPHLLGQSQHAARPGGHELRELDRDLPGALPGRRLDARDEGPQLRRTSNCSRPSRTI